MVDRWFHEKADKHQADRCRITTVHAPDHGLVAFYALGFSASQVNRRRLPFYFGGSYFPSLRLEWLGVREDLQGDGLGTIVMGRVLQVFRDMIDVAFIPAMTLLPASTRAGNFYRRIGFVDLLNRQGSEMVLPASDVLAVAKPTPPEE